MNEGYQRDDAAIVDYQLWRLPELPLRLRGPALLPLPQKYGVAIGAAQTFGRFVAEPWPLLLARQLGVPVLNLGISGAGPSLFLLHPGLVEIAMRAQFVIVQVMSARSVSNSRVRTGTNQGTLVRLDKPQSKPRFAEDVYRELLAELSLADLEELRAEARARFV